MGIVFRQSVKTTIVTSIGALLGAFVIYLSTQFIPKQEFGFTRNLTNQALVAGQILMFGLHGTLAVYVHRYDNDTRKRTSLIGFSLLIPAILLSIFVIFYFVFKNWIIQHFQAQDIPFITRYFFWLPIFALFFIYQIILEQYLISQLKVALATSIREILLRVLNIILIVLFGLGYINFDVFVASTVLAYIVPILLLLFIATRVKGFGISLNWKAFSKVEYKDMLHFTWYHALLGISVNLLGFLDALMLAPLDKKGFSALAVYGVAVFIMSVLQIPYKAMMISTYPVLTKAFRDNDNEKAKDIFIRSSLNILIASTIVACIISCNLSNAVAIMKNGYEEIIPIALILMIGRLVDIATGMNDQVLSLSKYYKANFYMSLALLAMMITLNRIFIPIYGIYGAAWSTTIAITLYNICKYYYVWIKLRFNPFSSNTVRILIAGCIAGLLGYLIPYMINPYIDTVLRSISIVFIYFLMLLWLKPSEDLRKYLQTIKETKRLF